MSAEYLRLWALDVLAEPAPRTGGDRIEHYHAGRQSAKRDVARLILRELPPADEDLRPLLAASIAARRGGRS